jgi:hypothetical protein
MSRSVSFGGKTGTPLIDYSKCYIFSNKVVDSFMDLIMPEIA